MQDFSASDLLAALDELATVLQQNRSRGRIYVAGGAAMLLATTWTE